MNQTVTQEDLLRYIYQETGALENELIREELESNWSLKLLYSEMLFAHSQLLNIKSEPSRTSLAIIMDYSKSTSTQNISLE